MEFQHHSHGFLEEIMLDSNIAFGMDYIDDHFDQNALLGTPSTSVLESPPLSVASQTTSSPFEDFSLPFGFDPQTLNCTSFGQHFTNPFVDHELLSAAASVDHTPANIKPEAPPPIPMYGQDYYYSVFSSVLDDVQNCHFAHGGAPQGATGGDLEAATWGKNGKGEGQQPSKNLMAERRRRKRLNDRLSMLRSLVPKITKMDRTSILSDTIDYMKELIEKIKHMQQEMELQMEMDTSSSSSSHQFSLVTEKPKEIFIRNSPKFEVERRNTRETRVQVCCSGKPELLISTMSTLEALGLQINQCVISCFNDFTMHASCSEEMEQRLILTPDDIKQALFRNAGYGGRCL